jgi:hypothetical protein
VGVRRFFQLRSGGGRMTPIWGTHLPEIQASGSRCAARQVAEIAEWCSAARVRRTAQPRRALASSAPFCRRRMHDGRLRREPDAAVSPSTKTRTDGSRQTS